MPFARVQDEDAGGPRALQHRLAGRHGPAQQGDVVAERRAEAVRLEKIPLHIDDQQRAPPKIDRERLGLGRHLALHGMRSLRALRLD